MPDFARPDYEYSQDETHPEEGSTEDTRDTTPPDGTGEASGDALYPLEQCADTRSVMDALMQTLVDATAEELNRFQEALSAARAKRAERLRDRATELVAEAEKLHEEAASWDGLPAFTIPATREVSVGSIPTSPTSPTTQTNKADAAKAKTKTGPKKAPAAKPQQKARVSKKPTRKMEFSRADVLKVLPAKATKNEKGDLCGIGKSEVAEKLGTNDVAKVGRVLQTMKAAGQIRSWGSVRWTTYTRG